MGNYLSSCKITLAIKPSFEVMCRANNPSVDVAVNRVYMAGNVSTPSVSSYLAFPPLPGKSRRYFSVALSLGSPPAAVSRYSCPEELGLSSDAHFRTAPATVRPAHMFLFYGTSAILSIHRISNLHRMKKAMLKTGYLSAYPYRTRL